MAFFFWGTFFCRRTGSHQRHLGDVRRAKHPRLFSPFEMFIHTNKNRAKFVQLSPKCVYQILYLMKQNMGIAIKHASKFEFTKHKCSTGHRITQEADFFAGQTNSDSIMFNDSQSNIVSSSVNTFLSDPAQNQTVCVTNCEY